MGFGDLGGLHAEMRRRLFATGILQRRKAHIVGRAIVFYHVKTCQSWPSQKHNSKRRQSTLQKRKESPAIPALF